MAGLMITGRPAPEGAALEAQLTSSMPFEAPLAPLMGLGYLLLALVCGAVFSLAALVLAYGMIHLLALLV